VPAGVEGLFLGKQSAVGYAPASSRLHLDAKNFYLGVGSHIADNMRLEEHHTGKQIPAEFILQSRYFDINPYSESSLPVYAQVSHDAKRIGQVKLPKHDVDLIDPEPDLGDGIWQRSLLRTNVPLLSDTIVQVDQFTDFDVRNIRHSEVDTDHSVVRSWRTGLMFRLPIDGKAELPSMFQSEENSGFRQYVHHIMDWNAELSLRPSVVRRGPYGESIVDEKIYFSADGRRPDPALENFDEQMDEHQRVTFSTNHVWRLFEKGWDFIPAANPQGTTPIDDLRERARRELLYSLDRPVKGDGEIIQDQNFLVNRYRLTERNQRDVVSFGSSIGYDFLKAKRQKRARDDREELVALGRSTEGTEDPSAFQPWTELQASLGISMFGVKLSNDLEYNIYRRTYTQMIFSLGLPTVLSTDLSLGYRLERKLLSNGVYELIPERHVKLGSGLIPLISIAVLAKDRVVNGERNFEHGQSVIFTAPSECWDLAFTRMKYFAEDEYEADYTLQFSMIFMGQKRGLPQMGKAVEKRLKPDEEIY
jgi:hypothetical protein